MTEDVVLEEIITNKHELAEWICNKVVKEARKKLKAETDEVSEKRKKLNLKYQEVSQSIREIAGYAHQLQKYDENLKKRELALTDRNNNLQNIYNKIMLFFFTQQVLLYLKLRNFQT